MLGVLDVEIDLEESDFGEIGETEASITVSVEPVDRVVTECFRKVLNGNVDKRRMKIFKREQGEIVFGMISY